MTSKSIIQKMKTMSSNPKLTSNFQKSLFSFWYSEAKRYIKEVRGRHKHKLQQKLIYYFIYNQGSYPKAFSILFRYYSDQLNNITLVERVKASKLMLYILNKLLERKYFGGVKSKKQKKLAEFMTVSMNYLILFHDSLTKMIEKSTGAQVPNITKKFSTNLISPLKKSQLKVFDEDAKNVASMEKMILKRISGSLSIFGSFFPKKKNQEQGDSNIINSLFYFNEFSEEKIPPANKSKY